MTARRLTWTCLAVLAAYPALVGFSASSTFEASADLGGGGGLTFTGSGSSHGLGCTACHEGSEPGNGVGLASDPHGLFIDGFEPGMTYTIAVRLSPERKGLAHNGNCQPDRGGCNRNGFVAEFLRSDHLPAGHLCTDTGVLTPDGCDNDSGSQTTLLSGKRAVSGVSMEQPTVCGQGAADHCIDVSGMLAAGKTQDDVDQALMAAVKGRTEWRFQWRAPLAAAPVAFHLGLVDGDGGTRVSPDHNDYYGDDVYMSAMTLWPKGMAPKDAAGCAAVPATRTGLWTLAALALAAGALRLRRRHANDANAKREMR